ITRLREMGVRKVMGANRTEIFGQILVEAIITSLFALVLGFFMMLLLRPQVGRMSIAQTLDLSITSFGQLALLFLGFALVVGLVAGIIPALTLAKTRPIAALQKLQNLRLMQRVGLRKFLLATQFTVTLIFLMLMTIAWRQGNHAISVNFGFDQPQTLLVQLQGAPFDRTAAALGQVAGVEKLSGISIPMGTWMDNSDDVRTDSVSEKTGVRDYYIDHNYVPNFHLKLLAGENFPDNPAQKNEVFALVNETFLTKFKLGEAHEAINKQLLIGDSTRLTVRGVLADFAFKPAVYKMEPLLLRYNPTELGVINLQLNAVTAIETREKVETAWKRLYPNTPFEAEFFDDTARGVFSESLDLVRMVGFFGFLGMALACMGLLGMAIYTVETKAKEISLRKVMGATGRDVVFFLSKGYLWLLGIAAAIAIPVVFLAGSQILAFFSNSIPMSPLLFLPGMLLLITAAGLAVGSQTWRALRANPVDNLRNE
ncbi:MAG: FtsX-like permease family protein, partial [Saprospiraceae bacterium]|nr:FtsX-like permease family protein [Saprospiraceae bacterium]